MLRNKITSDVRILCVCCVQNILTEMVKIEMVYHAKALEYLSRCFESMQQISVEQDLDVSGYDI